MLFHFYEKQMSQALIFYRLLYISYLYRENESGKKKELIHAASCLDNLSLKDSSFRKLSVFPKGK